jgi:alpha/beta superfamily hydrolase
MTDVVLPGGREVYGTLDGNGTSIVVACPPHPQHRGHRGDARLMAVSEALCEQGTACLRFDYGEWDEGYGEREDARNAIRWAGENYDSVGFFGFSFGGAMAILAAASVEESLMGVSALAPASRVTEDLDVVAAVSDLDSPLQVLYGTRDTTTEWEPVVDAAKNADAAVEELSADHFFLRKHDRIGKSVAEFFDEDDDPSSSAL